MKTMRNWFSGLVLGSAALFGISCAGTNEQREGSMTPASAPAEDRIPPISTETVDGCTGDRPGEPRQCKSNEDCCEGFSCAFDPGRSHVIKYCLEG